MEPSGCGCHPARRDGLVELGMHAHRDAGDIAMLQDRQPDPLAALRGRDRGAELAADLLESLGVGRDRHRYTRTSSSCARVR